MLKKAGSKLGAAVSELYLRRTRNFLAFVKMSAIA